MARTSSLGRHSAPAAATRSLYIALLCMELSACGGGGGDSSPPPNTPPTARNVTLSTAEDTAVGGTLVGQDADGNTLAYSIVSNPAHGTVALTGASFSYTPHDNYFGPDNFTYSVSDGRASASATVSVDVTAVNDPPKIELARAPAFMAARLSGTIDYMISDVDGPPASATITQIQGPGVASLDVTDTGASFVAPELSRVEDVVLRIEAQDAEGASASQDVRIPIHPLSASGRMLTLHGGTVGGGIDWIIIADGYTIGEREKFVADARKAADYVLNNAPIEVYKPAWNVHLVHTDSAESGIDVPDENIFVNTALDATICNERVVCANSSKVFQTVIAEHPGFELVLLLSNTDRYAGGGGVFATATAHETSGDIVLHELGHTFAGLTDEYADLAPNPNLLLTFREDLYPNATRLTDPTQIKWRHWFADPLDVPHNPGDAGIGLFEGSYYHSTGFFRPADQSFMRLSAGVWSDVHVEAWALSIYRLGGRARSVFPTGSSVSVARGTPTLFTVDPLLPVPTQTIQWFVDRAEWSGTRNLTAFMCCDQFNLQDGIHEVAVRVYDGTGKIRMPNQSSLPPVMIWTVDYR